MKASQLIVQLSTLIAEHGDLTVIGQCDAEGNSYDKMRGADFTYVSKDLDCTVDSMHEAEEYPGTFIPAFVVYP